MAGNAAEAADAAKAEGNAAFKEKRYPAAVEAYSRAIALSPSAALYGNRAFANLRMENFGSAIADATEALGLDKGYAKAYYRRAEANFLLGHYKQAVGDFRAAARLAPKDPDLRRKLALAERELKRARFEAALSCPELERSVCDEIHLDDIIVESDYDGITMQEATQQEEEKDKDAKKEEKGEAPGATKKEEKGEEKGEAPGATKKEEKGEEKGATKKEEKEGATTVAVSSSGALSAFPVVSPPASKYVLTRDFVLRMLETFKAGKQIHKRFAYEIVLRARLALRALPAVVDVPVPRGRRITVCGDVHGQFFDLLRIFELNGLPDSRENPYLFNGDFVDRGSWSCEVVLVLLAFHVADPGSVYLARGNHEARSMNAVYGFNGEVKHKFGARLVECFRETFCALPLAHVLGEKVLVLHGGLFASDDVTLADLRAVDRFREPPESGPMCDALWSDPDPAQGRSPNKRGVGVAFGPDVTKRFLEKENLQLLVRSHEVKEEGYEVAHDGYCVTVFSAPNYCDQAGNKGAWITFKGDTDMEPEFTTFEAAPHPNIPPMRYTEMGGLGGMMGGF